MKKLFIALGMAALLAGCASHDNGMGGTSDQDATIKTDQDTMKTDSIHSTQNGGSLHNNATNGTGSDTAPNDATQTPQTPQ